MNLNVLVVLLMVMVMTGCSNHLGDMRADTMRAAIDNCRDSQLGVQVYQRPDKSVISIRCLPHPEEVQNTVTLRKRARMPVIHFLSDPVDAVVE